ncbi:helix-turn-helix transcriptional regulator [Streptomyces sp. 1222.5]|uniref:helix-turn-helix transcriptional regulator n=1 Tax=Streptomyces sp. 1222.5 TaxID=1881026 RepID=UPI003D75F622
MEKRRELGERIGYLRVAADHTQESFSEATGLSRRTLQRIEAGTADVRYSDLLKMAAVLDEDVADIIRARR